MILTQKQIEKGYWYFRPNENFPPTSRILDDYCGEEVLDLTCTYGNEPYHQINKRERTYAQEIPTKLKPVKFLWANHINQETFNSICQLKSLTSLYINSKTIKEIPSIENLKNLKHLALINFTKVENIEPLSRLKQLVTLKLENFKKVSNFIALSGLINLEGLQIDGDMYTAQRIDNFDFLSNMEKLSYLTLTNSRASRKDFTPLTNLSELQMIRCSHNYPKVEFEKLQVLKKLKYFGNAEKLIKNVS